MHEKRFNEFSARDEPLNATQIYESEVRTYHLQ